MALDLVNYDEKAKAAIMAFWGNRDGALRKKLEAGSVDQGNRGAVTSGKHMDGFVELIRDLIVFNGLGSAHMKLKSKALILPGYFRPTKCWDLLVVHEERLIAAIELKSQVGSFGNNFNNRAEEVMGTALDFWTAYRENAFGEITRPFVGWIMLVEDNPRSRSPVRNDSPNYPVFSDFENSSYIQRYDILCKKLVQEQLYTTATVLTSPRSAVESGQYDEVSEATGLKSFVTSFAGHIAVEAARS